MKIELAELVLLNDELKKLNSRYHIDYKNETTACIESPGECCLTQDMKEQTMMCIQEYYRGKNARVIFSEDFLYFYLEDDDTDPDNEVIKK